MAASSTNGPEDDGKKGTLDVFDGTRPSEYRRWRRRAELYLMGLPTNVPERKWGARLLEHLSGEAEELLEQLPIEKIAKDKGYEEIFDLLDEKYKELAKDELQRVMKEYFYSSVIKPNETYRSFIVRLDTTYKSLVRHGVELPGPVRGWLLMRKMLLDPTSEAMVLTSTKGSVEYSEIVTAVRAVFPHGQCAATKTKERDVFITSNDFQEVEAEKEYVEEETPMEVMEVIALQAQEHSDYESEDALEVYETYTDIKKRVQEKKINRGYKSTTEKKQEWQLQGNIRGKIEVLKQKTKCHKCRRYGHWKRECPLNKSSGGLGSKGKGNQDNSAKEVHLVDEDERIFYESYVIHHTEVKESQKPELSKVSKVDSKKDFWEINEQDGTVTRVHVKPRKGLFTPHGVAGIPVDPENFDGRRITKILTTQGVSKEEKDNYHTSKIPHRNMGFPWTGKTTFFVKEPFGEGDLPVSVTKNQEAVDDMIEAFEADVLRGTSSNEGAKPGVCDSFSSEVPGSASLSEHAVPDTACRKTLVGAYTLRALELNLNDRSYKIHRRRENNEFKFGNAGVLKSEETAQIPVAIGSRRLVISAAVLPGSGSNTPFLLSQELLKRLKCVIDTDRDSVVFKELGQTVQMGRTERGHYAIPIMPEDLNRERTVHGTSQPEVQEFAEETFNSDHVPRLPHGNSSKSYGPTADEIYEHPRCELSSTSRAQGDRCSKRPRDGRTNKAGAWRRIVACREVRQECKRSSEHGRSVSHQEGLREMGEGTHPDGCIRRVHQEVQALHRTAGWQEEGEIGTRTADASNDDSTTEQCATYAQDGAVQGDGQTKSQSQCGAVHDVNSPQDGNLRDAGDASGRSELHDDARDASRLPELHERNARNKWTSSSRSRRRRMDPAVWQQHGGRMGGDRGHHQLGPSLERVCAEDQSAGSGDSLEHDEGGALHRKSGGNEDVSLETDPTEEEWLLLEKGLDEITLSDRRKGPVDVMFINPNPDVDVAEVFSQPRVCRAAKAVGLACGESYDILTGFDLSQKSVRENVRAELQRIKPRLVVLCPPCGPYSQLQGLRKDKHVERHVIDQCMYGLKDRTSGRRHRKATGIMTNSMHVGLRLQQRCDRNHCHEPILGKTKVHGVWRARSSLAQEYPKQLVHAIIKGLLEDKHAKDMDEVTNTVYTVEALETQDERNLARILRRCHENLGHPSTARFVAMLKSARASEKCIQIAKGLKCQTCQDHAPPKSHNVSKVPRAKLFGVTLLKWICHGGNLIF